MYRTKDKKNCLIEGHVAHEHLWIVVLKIIARIVVSFQCLKSMFDTCVFRLLPVLVFTSDHDTPETQ